MNSRLPTSIPPTAAAGHRLFKSRPLVLASVLATLCTITPAAQAVLTLPAIFSNHMVLQRDQKNPVSLPQQAASSPSSSRVSAPPT